MYHRNLLNIHLRMQGKGIVRRGRTRRSLQGMRGVRDWKRFAQRDLWLYLAHEMTKARGRGRA